MVLSKIIFYLLQDGCNRYCMYILAVALGLLYHQISVLGLIVYCRPSSALWSRVFVVSSNSKAGFLKNSNHELHGLL